MPKSRTRPFTSILIVSFFIHLSAAPLWAQHSGFGPRVGVNLSTFNSSTSDYTYTQGLAIGFWGCRWLSDDWSFQPEILYSRLGATNAVSAYSMIPVKLDYLRLPLLMKWTPTPSWNIHFGPDAGYLLQGKRRSPEGAEDLSQRYAKVDAAFVVGTGIALSGGSDLSLRYTYGLSQLPSAGSADLASNQSVQLSWGLGFAHYKQRARIRAHASHARTAKLHRNRTRIQLL